MLHKHTDRLVLTYELGLLLSLSMGGGCLDCGLHPSGSLIGFCPVVYVFTVLLGTTSGHVACCLLCVVTVRICSH